HHFRFPGTLTILTDKHLAGYFSSTRIRRHLQRAGLITRSGRIVPDKEYRHKLIQRAHQRHVRECLAQAIFHKVLEMERLHQIEIKRKLEEFARRERVHKIKVERSKRYEEGIVHILSPHPPEGARGIRKQHSGPEGEHSDSSESPSSSRPNTAPGKMQRPVRLKPIHSNSTTASVRHSSPYRLLQSSHDNHLPFNCTASHGISPYCLPVINNFVTPVPPATKRKERGLKGTASSTVRGRRLRPTTASSGADVKTNLIHLCVSRVCVNMVYFGKTVRLSSDLTDMRDDVKVFQQHCGGENLCVYKGKLHEGETFQFISRRHRGFPFSLTFFLNGLQVERLSSCCEFKHRKGSRLGGKHGHFGFTGVEGASPCYKCIIAMGLDKKPTPPPKRIKEDTRREESVNSPKDEGEMETERTGEDAGSHLEALHPSKEENVTQDDKTTEPLEETPAETADTEAAEEEEGKEKTAEETDVQHDETGQGAKSSEEDESSEPDKKTDETAAPDNAEAVTARETIEIKAESSKEQEALSYEEAPVSDAEKEEQADSEDRAAGSETEVNAENSSSSPSGSGETTVEKIADTGEENAIEESSKDDIKEEQVLEDESHEQCELREERRTGASEETGEKEGKEKTEEGGKEEEEKQTHVTSDKGEEDENTEKRDDDEQVKNEEEGNEESKEDEGTDKQENTAESAENGFKTKEDEEEEAVKSLSEEDKVADDEKVEEKTENDENSECVENKLEESEVGDKSEGDNDNESKPAVQENDDEAEKSENQNKAEKSEDKEKHDEEDDKEKDISEAPVEEGEEISETTEEAEKSADVGANEAADGTKSADETPEAESVEQDAGKTSNTSEKEEINAENGEISTEAESNNHEDDGESQLKDKNDLKAKEEGDEESKADGPADDESADIKEVAVESEEGAKKHDADEVDQAPGADEVERDAEGDSVGKNDESTPSNSQPETAGTEMKAEPKLGDRKDGEEAEQDQNGNKSDCDNENKEPDLVKKESSAEENVDEVAAVSSGNQEQSPVAVDLDVLASKLDEESKDTKSDICPQTDENAVGGDLSAANGENGVDAEEASKASEEGASVLLKPQNNEADYTEETVAAGRESPEALAAEDSTDLVSNWVNKHQSSKFFETFVEPLEDMREEITDTPASSSNKEETKSTELPGSDSPLKMVRVSEDEVKAYRDAEDELQVEEKAEVKDLILKPQTEQSEEKSEALQKMRSEEHKGSMGSLQECNGQESAEKGINEENAFSKTEVESTSGSLHSATEKPASVSKSQPDEKTIDNNFNVTEPQTEEGNKSTSPLGTEDVNETWGKADEQSREVTETTDFTTSKSDDGSPEDSRNEEIEGKASDRSVSRDRKDLQLIDDIKHTLSKDRLSAFSVDDTLFAHSSYPLLTAASAESGH
uniref:Glutamate rich 3 n=1 Tax=Pundamilia nyererei TaxID=303518 RepID=A0A3B4FDK4_9CICH